MRDIFFKAKRLDNGEWVEGYIFKVWDRTYILWGTTNDIPNMIEVDALTVSEFTGLTDRNGTKIFEGDIVNIYWKNNIICCGDIRYNEQDCRFVIFEDYIFPYGFDKTNDLEVIGNIHDNPELLGE